MCSGFLLIRFFLSFSSWNLILELALDFNGSLWHFQCFEAGSQPRDMMSFFCFGLSDSQPQAAQIPIRIWDNVQNTTVNSDSETALPFPDFRLILPTTKRSPNP
ncbi:hypothetical protein DM860_018132 [Cuscuta australis]|uniref:Uncharacterized protein n=1 Tax=Cuscuta australis TaxID=267555 RepID=A0A328DVM5_9ASTE|nr:hypothetical protein DM860_018132 [Cuscuta australis]